ncbi:MAG: hypothetical protein WA148_07755 [Actinomycetota bacterium]
MTAKRKTTKKEAPGYGDIAAELKNLGSSLKEAFKATLESEQAKKVQRRASDAFDSLTEAAGRLMEEAKSGKLEKDMRKGLYKSLQSLNKKLKGYSASARSKKSA